MKTELETLLKTLKNAGWQIEMRPPDPGEVTLPKVIGERFGKLPDDYLEFLAAVSKCINPAENAWFLTAEDFAVSDGATFVWNWIEVQFAPDGKDQTAEIAWHAFWRQHLPIFFCVHSEYDYLALRLAHPERSESVVHGFAPEFELPSKVADSFTHLCVMLTRFFERGEALPDILSAILSLGEN